LLQFKKLRTCKYRSLFDQFRIRTNTGVKHKLFDRLKHDHVGPGGGHTYVLKQPETPEEEALCKEAMEGCPVEAIGNDGE
jgi:ferredoxin